MFALLDDVFTEDDAFSNEKIKKGMGRLYREWKRIRTLMDPDFDRKRFSHKRVRRGLNVADDGS
jgi:hypothetical protein